jgi:hypothetical protein
MISMPFDDKLLQWWKHMKPAKQHRCDPLICQAPYSKKRPIFNQTGCSIFNYMSPSAPRCQTQYLHHLCSIASQEIGDTTFRHTIMPESDHANTYIPPTPWILTAKDSFVTACGQIIAGCGYIHTTANCMAENFKMDYPDTFRSDCHIDKQVFNEAAAGLSVKCPSLSTLKHYSRPDVTEITYYKRVFIVAEVDDTYVYFYITYPR